jgi:hypothetical protein
MLALVLIQHLVQASFQPAVVVAVVQSALTILIVWVTLAAQVVVLPELILEE